jgi:dihydropteroate synthase
LAKLKIMGVLNVTPDSFSDGGAYTSVQAAVDAALWMWEQGATLIDVGGESTRPGAAHVPTNQELDRVLPVIAQLCARGVSVSIDTSKAEVARQSLRAGASMVNDVTALRDPEMGSVCARAGCAVCLMHMKGDPTTMQANPEYKDVVQEVADFLSERANGAKRSGINAGKIWIDPGIGFGKTDPHNWTLIREIDSLVSFGYPVLLGVSRKGFLGRILATKGASAPVRDRMIGGLAVQAYAHMHGVSMVRTHDVKAAVELAKTMERMTD